MNQYLSILRGINVSGQKIIKMDSLKSLFEIQNFSNVKTYIQSGNIIFCSEINNKIKVEQRVEKIIKEKYNFTVPAIILSYNDLHNIIINNPFMQNENLDHSNLYVTLLKTAPDKSLVKNILNFASISDQFEFLHNSIYLYCANGYGKTKFNNNFFENKLNVTATTRNWKTINKLLEILGDVNCGK